MNYPVNTKPRLSAVAIASGVLFALAALITLIMDLINKSFASRNFFYNGLFALGIFAFIAVAVLIFVRAKEAFLAVPFGILALQSVIYFIADIRDCFLYDLMGVEYLFYLFIDLLCVAPFVLMIVTAVSKRFRNVFSIIAGIIYCFVNLFFYFRYIFYSINYGYFDFEVVLDIIYYIPDILVAIAMILLGVALSKLAPSIPKYAPNAYAQRPPMPNGYALNGYVPNGYAPGGYAQRPPVQNNYGYAPMQNGGYAPMHNPVNTQAPTAQPLQNNYQNSVPAQVSNDNSAPQATAENVAPSVDEAAVENTSAPQTDTDKLASELSAYKKMLENGLISEADFEAKKKQLLGL